MAVHCARAFALLAPRPINQAVGGRRLSTAILALNITPEAVEALEPLFVKNATSALRLAHILERAEQDKVRAEQDKARAEQDRDSAEATAKLDRACLLTNIESVSKELAIAEQAKAIANEYLLKRTTRVYTWCIQETLERKLGVEEGSRPADWDKVLQDKANYDLVYNIVAECLKTPLPPFSPAWKPTSTQLGDVTRQIILCYSYINRDRFYHKVHKNAAGHLVIDTTQKHMCVVYQLGVKLSTLEPDIVVVKAPWLTEQNETCTK